MGATLALLYAPQSGEETRRILGERIREGRDAAVTADNVAKIGSLIFHFQHPCQAKSLTYSQRLDV